MILYFLFREFSRMREDGENPEAADLLHSLLWSRLAPKYFWITLLIDAVPYLTSDEVKCLERDMGQWAVYYTSPQCFKITFSYLLA